MPERRTRKQTAYRPRSAKRRWRVSEAEASDRELRRRLEFLLMSFGNNRLATLLGVNPSQPSRWRSGEERIGVESERRLLDLDYVAVRLLRLFPAEQVEIWLSSYNGHLGARPVDVLRLRGAAAISLAIDAEAEGAYV